MNLLDLPHELLTKILCFLDPSDLISCNRTNYLLHTTIQTSVKIQYHLNLRLHGLTDNPSCALSTAERLHLLKTREESWSTLNANFKSIIDVHHQTSSIYELTGGFLVLGEAHRTRTQTKALKYCVLPSIEDDDVWEGQSGWLGIDPNTLVLDIGLGVRGLDLMVIVTARHGGPGQIVAEVQLYQLSTGKPHPAAKHHTLPLATFREMGVRPRLNIEISGNHLAIIFKCHTPVLLPIFVLYDWKMGKVNMFSRLDPCYDGLVFLDHQTLLLTNIGGYLDIFPIPNFNDFPSSCPLPLRITRALSLPSLSPDCGYLYIHCRAEPNPTGPDSQLPEDAVFPYDRRPFHNSSEDAIVLFDITISGAGRTYSLFVHRKALLAHTPPYPPPSQFSFPLHSTFPSPLHEDNNPSDIGTVSELLLWQDWGPTVCRWISTDNIRSSWITTSTGQRYVGFFSSPNIVQRVIVLDFNPYRIRLQEKTCTKVVTLPSRARDEHSAFAEDVTSHLPYAINWSKELSRCSSVMMDEERIIGLHMDQGRHIVSVEVLHFG